MQESTFLRKAAFGRRPDPHSVQNRGAVGAADELQLEAGAPEDAAQFLRLGDIVQMDPGLKSRGDVLKLGYVNVAAGASRLPVALEESLDNEGRVDALTAVAGVRLPSGAVCGGDHRIQDCAHS